VVSRILCLLFCIVFLGGCAQTTTTTSSTTGGASVYDRVTQNGKLRCGYVLYNPGCMKDPNTGKLSGIGVEVLEKVCEKLGIELVWAEEVGWGSMLEGLQTNRYDLIATPVWTNANRAKLVDFSKPLYYSPVLAYVKAGDKRFADTESLNNEKVRIATIDGETAEVIAASDFPKAKKVSLPQLTDVSQLLLTVSTGKADVTFAEPTVGAAYSKSNANSIDAIKGIPPVRVFPNCWTFRRGQYEFREMIDTVLDELVNSGYVDKVVAKYEAAPGTLYRIAPGYQLPAKTK